MIVDEIKNAYIEAMKNKDEQAKIILGIIKNKFLMASIEKGTERGMLEDADATKILVKTEKELTEEAENYAKVNNTEEEQNILAQRNIIEKFIPKLMSEEEIKAEILKLEDKSVPNVMRHFKTNFAGKCDMGAVNKILRSL